MPISLELWRAAVERWVARIKRTLVIRRGVKRAPSDKEGAPFPSGQSHTGEKKCMVKKKGRKKHMNDSYGDPGITTDDFYDGIIALAVTLMCFGSNASKDCRDKNPVAPLKELLDCTGLGPLLVVTMILLLRSGDVEPNPGPVERVDVPISLEQSFAASGLLASSIQQTLTYSVGLIKTPLFVPSREVAFSPTGKPDDDKGQCLANTTGRMKHENGGKPEDDKVQRLGNTTGRMKHKDGSFCDTMVTKDKFNVALASVLKRIIGDVKFTDGSGTKLVCTQVELKGLSQLLGIVCLFLRSGSGEANIIPVEGGPISHQEDGMVFDESLHFEVNADYHCAKWMKSDPEANDILRCPVSNDVPHLSSGKLAHLVLSAKNALARGMTALIAIFLWCMVLVDYVCIVCLWAILLKVTLAKVKKRKAGFKPGTAVTLHSPSQQACMFKSGLVIHLFAICVSVFKGYEHQAMSQQVCCLLVSHFASLLRDMKCTEKFLFLTFCFALLWYAICIGKWLSQALFKPYAFLRGLLLLAGDVETNPGPIQAEEVLLVYRDRFIAEVDASTVVMDLLHRGIIDEADQRVIAMEHNLNKRNQILHECLMKKCTNDALRTVCDVMIAIPGSPRMAALGNDMRKRLEIDLYGVTEQDELTLSTAVAESGIGKSDMGPMKKWNRDALDALRGKLKENVIMNHGLNDKLVTVAGGFMNGAEAQAVQSKTNNAEQMGELISILLGKSDADFGTFCAMLRAVKYEVWANELEKNAEMFKQTPGTHPANLEGTAQTESSPIAGMSSAPGSTQTHGLPSDTFASPEYSTDSVDFQSYTKLSSEEVEEESKHQGSKVPSEPAEGESDPHEEPEPATVKGFTEGDCSTLYHKAIRDNPTITLHVSKAMTIGPPRTGKTALRHHLLQLLQPEVSSSVPVMKTAETVSGCPFGVDNRMFLVTKNKWVLVNNDSVVLSLLTHLRDTIAALSSTAQKPVDYEIGAEDNNLPSTHEIAAEDSLLHSSHETAAEDNMLPRTHEGMHREVAIQPSDDKSDSVALMSSRIYRELQNPDLVDVALSDTHLLQFLDCRGLLAYHDILPLFVNIPAIYLNVFNVTEELTEYPIDELCTTEGNKMYAAKSALSVAEMITRSAITVRSLADRKVPLLPDLTCESKPRFMLVGTHLDKLDERYADEQLKASNDILQETLHLKSHLLERMVIPNKKSQLMFFPVNNKLYVDKSHLSYMHCKCKHCRATKNLKRKITKQAMEDAIKVDVPVRWYLHQLLELSQSEKPFYSYSELYERCRAEGSVTDTGEFHAMVTYFHALGLLIHLCGADVGHTEESACLVFTNPSQLFENISKLYLVQFEEVSSGDKILLKHEGKLTRDALRELGVQLNPDHFMDLLVQLFIGAEIKSQEGDRILFVPSVLTSSPDDSAPSGVSTGPQDESLRFAITFESTSFIPCGVFTGMSARLQNALGWAIFTKSISRKRMMFTVGTEGTVTLFDHATHISVNIDHHEGQYLEYRDTIIKAVADSYCFLFHSKSAKDPQSTLCSVCVKSPHLVLGQTCQECCAPRGTPEAPHFAELKVGRVTKTVRCPRIATSKKLSESECDLFQNMCHYAVVERQHIPPSQTATKVTVQVIEEHREEFLQTMNATAIALQLQVQGLIPESVKRDIDQSKCVEDANGILLTFLLTRASEIQVQQTFKIASERMDYGRMGQFAASMFQQLQPATKVTVQVITEHREEFLQEMNATAIALQLQVQGLISESVKRDIDQSKCMEDANGHLLTFLLTGASEIQVQQTFKVASERMDYGRMRQFAASILQQLQPDFTEKDISELYQKAINEGPIITLHVAKAMTIGPPRVGKTCFRHHLLGLQPPEYNPSTPVMTTAEAISLSFVQSSTDDQRWIPLRADSGIMSLLEHLREDTMPNEAASHEQAEGPTFTTVFPSRISNRDVDLKGIVTALPDRPVDNVSPISTALPDPTVDNVSPMPNIGADFTAPTASLVDKQPQVEHTSDEIRLQIQKMVKSVKDQDKITLPDAHLLQFIDCGGQLAYHDILPIFVNIPAIYLHVFNLLVELTECPEDRIRNEDGTVGFSAQSPLTIAQMMARSVLVIRDLACKRVQLPKEVAAEGTPQPTVAFIGTHYDRFFAKYGDQTGAKLNDISTELKSVCIRDVKVMSHKHPALPPMLFPVNNYAEKATGNDDRSSLSTSLIKKAIEEEVVGVKVKVPVLWYLFQLLQWAEKGKEVHTYGELCKSCATFGLTDEGDIYAMVTYFHALGLFLHHCRHDGKKHIEDAEGCECLVFTDPSYLFENITKLYQVQFWRDEDVHDCLHDLKKYGKLTKEALTELKVGINQEDYECFMDILVQLFIGADIESSDNVRSLFVPSVLTDSIDIGDPSGAGATPHEHSVHFAIAFGHGNDTSGDRSYIPCGVFTGMIARLQSTEGWKYFCDSISRLHVEFQVSTYTVKLYDHATHIGIVLKSEEDEEEAVEGAVKDFVHYCGTIIEATANSYCFLFHSNATKLPQIKACGDCTARPYLILGRTCLTCTAPKDLHFLKLQKKRETLFVRCQKTVTKLNDTDCIPFQSISHCAVVKEQRTFDPAQAGRKSGENPPSVPDGSGPSMPAGDSTPARRREDGSELGGSGPTRPTGDSTPARRGEDVRGLGVSADARGQECIAPPTTTGPHIVEHPTKDMRYVLAKVSKRSTTSYPKRSATPYPKRSATTIANRSAATKAKTLTTAKGSRQPASSEGTSQYTDASDISMPAGDSTPARRREDVRGLAMTVQVIENYTKEFLQEMNASAIALQLVVQHLIPESVKHEIDQSKCPEDANGHLLTFLMTGASEIQVLRTFKVASEKTNYGRMSHFAAKILPKLQPVSAKEFERLHTTYPKRSDATYPKRSTTTYVKTSATTRANRSAATKAKRFTTARDSRQPASSEGTSQYTDHSVETIAPTHKASVKHSPPLQQCSLQPRLKRAAKNLQSEISKVKEGKGGGGGQR